jgi:hypothetical protein
MVDSIRIEDVLKDMVRAQKQGRDIEREAAQSVIDAMEKLANPDEWDEPKTELHSCEATTCQRVKGQACPTCGE